MNLSQILLILKARYKIVLFTLIVTVVVTTLVSILLPKSYTANTTVIVNYKGVDPVTGVALPAQLMPGYMATQVEIISSKNVALKVIQTLGLAESSAVKSSFESATQGEGNIQDWLSELLLKNLDVSPSKTSSIIDIGFKGSNPQFAAAISNAFAEAYISTNIQLKVEPSQKAAKYFTAQVKELRDDLEKAQERLSKYQQEKGIISVDERLDVERARLNDLSSQLVLAQGQSMEAQSRQRNAAGSGAYDSPDIASNPLIQGLKTEVARAESRFADISQKYERNHPMYQGSKAEIENLKAELNRQIQVVSSSVATNSKILKQRENEIRGALESQRAKVLELNRDRDALAVLTREIENAQRAYDVTTQRFTQSNIEGQSNQSDVAILNPATAPSQPSSPKVMLNIILSIFVGLLLGVGFGVLAEMLDRKVRSSEDIVDLLEVPLLAVLPKDRSRKLLGIKKVNPLRIAN